MVTRTMKRPAPQRFFRKRASALIATLVTVALVAFVVGAMLLNVQHMTKLTNDKIQFEEAYYTAQSGVEMAKAWIFQPELARRHLPVASASKFNGLTSGSIGLTRYVKENSANPSLLSAMTGDQIAAFYSPHLTIDGRTLYGGRKVLFEYTGSANNKCVNFANDAVTTPVGSNLFRTASNTRSYVSSIRITTPFRSTGVTTNRDTYIADNLKYVTLIVEAVAVVESRGVPKTRFVQQKLLAVPNDLAPDDELAAGLSPGAAIVSGNSLVVQGSSHMDVYWGAVKVKGDIDLLDITGFQAERTKQGDRTITLGLANSPNKWHGAGFDTPQDSPNVGVDEWVKWHASEMLYGKNGSSRTELFPRVTSSGDFAGVVDNQDNFTSVFAAAGTALPSDQRYISDFTTQMWNPYSNGAVASAGSVYMGGMNAMPNSTTGWGRTDVQLPGYSPNTLTSNTMYYGVTNASNIRPVNQGMFVQKNPAIATAVDSFFTNDLNYATWKQFAQAKSLYARPTNTGFVDANGDPLYLNTDDYTFEPAVNGVIPRNSNGQPYPRFDSFDDLAFIRELVPADGNTYNIPDRILFIDTPQGTSGGTLADYRVDSGFFWKGLCYIMGNLDIQGAGSSPSVWAKNPKQYLQDPKGTSVGYMVDRCIVDGLLYTAGNIDRNGNSAVYGTIACKAGMGSGGGPTIYFNSRELFKAQGTDDDGSASQLRQLVSGPIVELNAF